MSRTPPSTPETITGDATARRRYDNSRRREQAAATHRRILDCGCALVHESEVRDWSGLTVGAVATRAGVSERTVYRHFATERGLRDAVMHRIEQEAGIDLAGLRLAGVADVTERILEQVAAYPPRPRPPVDDVLQATHQRQRDALVAAVQREAKTWARDEVERVAAVLDVLWSVAAYERLVVDWEFDHGEATRALRGSIETLVASIAERETS